MIKSDNNSVRYEIESCQFVIPAVPLIADSEDFSNSERIQIAGVRSLETSLTQALFLANEMLNPVRKDLRNGRCTALVKLLETNPEFSAHPWVREEILKWIRTGRSFSKRGRRFGSYKVHPLVVAALVDELIARRWAPNRERAFVWLADNDWLEYETAKKRYYQAIREERFRAVLICSSIWSRATSGLKARQLIRRADKLNPAQPVTQILHDSTAGPTTVTFTAN